MNSKGNDKETPGAETQAEPEKKHIFDDPKNLYKLLGVFFFTCWFLFLLDLLFIFLPSQRHSSFHDGVFDAEGTFGFYGTYGFVACVILVLAAKQMRKFLMRKEDYYDE